MFYIAIREMIRNKVDKMVDPQKYLPYIKETIYVREICHKNMMNGMLDRIDYSIYGSEKFEDQPYIETQRIIEIKNLYNKLLIIHKPSK